MQRNDSTAQEATLDQPTLVPGGLYQLTEDLYSYDDSDLIKGYFFTSPHWRSREDTPEVFTLFDQHTGVYIGTSRIEESVRRPKSKGGSKLVRRLVHVFLWAGNRVIIKPVQVKLITAA